MTLYVSVRKLIFNCAFEVLEAKARDSAAETGDELALMH